MKQDAPIEDHVRLRLRSLRLARGWSLDELAGRCHIGASTISRIETGHRRIALDQLALLAQALGTTIDDLLGPEDEDAVIRPVSDVIHGVTVWPLTRQHDPTGRAVMKMRMPALPVSPTLMVHPGRDWLYVMKGTVRLCLGDREILVRTGEAAEFNTMTPHAVGGHRSAAEILTIFDRDGARAHLHQG